MKQESHQLIHNKTIRLLATGLAKVLIEEPITWWLGNLYCIKPSNSCVMSLTTLLCNGASQVKAVIKEDADVLVIPADKALAIAKEYPKWNEFVYDILYAKFEELFHVSISIL